MTRKRLTKESYYSTRCNQIPLEAQQLGMQHPKPLSAYWHPQPERLVSADWKRPSIIRVLGYRPDRNINLDPHAPIPEPADRTIRFQYSSTWKGKMSDLE